MIFGLLATQFENAWLGALGVSVELLLRILLGRRLCFLCALDDRVDVGVLVPGGGGVRDYGVPDYGFRIGVAWFLGGEGGSHVDEDLFCVPGEERCEVFGGCLLSTTLRPEV